MFGPRIPADVQESIDRAIDAAAEVATFGEWAKLLDESLALNPLESHVNGLGFVWCVEVDEMPAILSALRVGLIVCKAQRNLQDRRRATEAN